MKEWDNALSKQKGKLYVFESVGWNKILRTIKTKV
jgi:hypothetical protein